MDELFNSQLPEGQRPDIQLCIFPHLREFLVVDLREDHKRVLLMETGDVFVEEFYKSVEAEFSEVLREDTGFPFSHFINLPLRLEEIMRETAMTFILDRLDIDLGDEEEVPNVVVFVISGGALTSHADQVLDGLRELLKANIGDATLENWEEAISRLVTEEKRMLHQETMHDLNDALRGDSPDYFTLWESRN
ncbi:MAG: hypothetical protein CMJ45_06425 [Planctomyces sp.]|nr:hypothetical protein [Planctomyces sp.]